MKRAVIFLSLGSNLGDRKKNLTRALFLLRKEGLRILKRSSLYRTSPVGKKDQPDFYNCVVKASTVLSPEALLKRTRAVERSLGRERDRRWGPRTLDIDILLYEDLVKRRKDLRIPHPEMRKRNFVLVPLSEIEAGLALPPSGVPAQNLISPEKGSVKKLPWR